MNIKFVVLKESKPYKIFKVYRFNCRLFRRAVRRYKFYLARIATASFWVAGGA